MPSVPQEGAAQPAESFASVEAACSGPPGTASATRGEESRGRSGSYSARTAAGFAALIAH